MNNIFTRVQYGVLREFGFEEDQLDDGLNYLRSAQSLYPNDDEIRNSAYYIKYNRSCQGDLKEGDIIPDVLLHTLQQTPIRLMEYYHSTCRCSVDIIPSLYRPLVVFSGSLT